MRNTMRKTLIAATAAKSLYQQLPTRDGAADGTVAGGVAVGAGVQPQPALQLELVSRWQPRPLITGATTVFLILTATARTAMVTATWHTATPTHIDALITVPIHTAARTIHTHAHIMDIRTDVMSCTGTTDTKSRRARSSDKNEAPVISGASNSSPQCPAIGP